MINILCDLFMLNSFILFLPFNNQFLSPCLIIKIYLGQEGQFQFSNIFYEKFLTQKITEKMCSKTCISTIQILSFPLFKYIIFYIEENSPISISYIVTKKYICISTTIMKLYNSSIIPKDSSVILQSRHFPTHSPWQSLISVPIALSFTKCYINGILQYVAF